MKREVERGSTFTLTYDFSYIGLYFICERKFYGRTHVKFMRQWKSTLSVEKISLS